MLDGLSFHQCIRCKKLSWDAQTDEQLANLKNSLLDMSAALFKKDRIAINFQGKSNAEFRGQTNQSTEETNFITQEPRFGLENVILSAGTRAQINSALAKAQHQELIYETWGFNEVDPIGAGAIFLFFGLPGTGKTRSAEALAYALKVPIMDVSLAQLESKFMGETAKNIEKVFELAGQKKALLFFDEADTVLGTRLSSITQGVDAEINLSRSTLLKELERFNGYCIFATNFQRNIDAAFKRRIHYHVEFQLPDAEALLALWEMHLVPGIPLQEERQELIQKLLHLTDGFSGGEILQAVRVALGHAVNRETNKILTFQDLQLAIEEGWKSKLYIGKKERSEKLELIKTYYNLKD